VDRHAGADADADADAAGPLLLLPPTPSASGFLLLLGRNFWGHSPPELLA
jgi:hypothetical protein